MRERLEMLMREARESPAPFTKEPELSVADIKKQDWVGIRLLSLLLSADPSSASIRDVQKSIEFYERKYSNQLLLTAINALNKERFADETWHNPASRLIRNANTENIQRPRNYD